MCSLSDLVYLDVTGFRLLGLACSIQVLYWMKSVMDSGKARRGRMKNCCCEPLPGSINFWIVDVAPRK